MRFQTAGGGQGGGGSAEPAGLVTEVQYNAGGSPPVFGADALLTFDFGAAKKFRVGLETGSNPYTYIQPNRIASRMGRTSATESQRGFDLIVQATGAAVDLKPMRIIGEQIDAGGAGNSSINALEVYANNSFSRNGKQSSKGIFVEVTEGAMGFSETLGNVYGADIRVISDKEPSNTGGNSSIYGTNVVLNVSNSDGADQLVVLAGVRVAGSGGGFNANSGNGLGRLAAIQIEDSSWGADPADIETIDEVYGVYIGRWGGGIGKETYGIRISDQTVAGKPSWAIKIEDQNESGAYSLYTGLGVVRVGGQEWIGDNYSIVEAYPSRGLKIGPDNAEGQGAALILASDDENTSAPIISLWSSNGTTGAPTDTVAGDTLGTIEGVGYASGAFSVAVSQIRFKAAADVSGDPTGEIQFITSDGLTTDPRLIITSAGGVNLVNAVCQLALTDVGTTLLSTLAAIANGAAAQVGTLTNSPAAGNPTKWIPINDNGITRYIPAW